MEKEKVNSRKELIKYKNLSLGLCAMLTWWLTTRVPIDPTTVSWTWESFFILNQDNQNREAHDK